MPKKKKGVDQRVKGNAKSASSQRMVELMGGGVGGVIGFSSVSSGLAQRDRFVSGAAGGKGGEDEVLYGESSQFQVVMKQLGKRDSTTKLKALQEFGSLVEQLPPPATVGVLNIWTLMYNKLSTDNDNRVRDHAHRALRTVIEMIHDGMESHLRSIIGCWVAGMCDTYAPAAASARSAFEAAFSAKKQEELYSVMFKPIVKHASELVLHLTPDTYSDPKVLASDERVQRYERAMCMAVSSLKLVLQTLSTEQLTSNKKYWEEFLSDKKLWLLTRHSNAYVRSAVYSIVPGMCHKLPVFVQQRGKVVCSAVLGSLGENDPLVVGAVWEAALMILAKTESWYSNVNIEKALLPGLWSLLKAGGYGSASIAYPCLLPLVSRLMDKVYQGNLRFSRSFLDHLTTGLSLDHPQTSRKEFEVQLRTFRECLLYLITSLDHEKPETRGFIEGAFEKVMTMVHACLGGGVSVMQSEVLLSNTVRLLASLIQLQTKCHALQPHLSNLQLSISKKVSSVLEKEEDVEANFSRVGSLLKCFCSHTLWSHLERKTVRLPSRDELSVTNLLPPTTTTTTITTTTTTVEEEQPEPTKEQREQTNDDSVRNFIAPTICSLCSCSIAEVSSAPHLRHSQLLLTMLRLYTTKSLIKSVFSSLESNQAHLLREHRGERVLHKKLLIICGILSKAARVKGKGISEHPEFSSNIVEAMLLLIKSELVEAESACAYLAEFVKPSPIILPLVVLKLRSTGQQVLLELLMPQVRPVFGPLFKDLQLNSSPFLWDFLGNLFSEPTDSSWSALDLCGSAFECMCSLLLDQFQDTFTLPHDMVRSMLRVVAKASSSLLEENTDPVTNLLSGLLHWCLFVRNELVIKEVVQCYQSLLSSLPDSASIIRSLPSLVTHHPTDSLLSYVVSGQVYFILHQDILLQEDHFTLLYEPFINSVTSHKDRWMPLSMLESFCTHSALYTPFTTDLISSQIIPTLAPPLCPLLYPLTALSTPHPALLQEVTSHTGLPQTEREVLAAMFELEERGMVQERLMDVIFAGEGVKGVACEIREALDCVGVALISLLPLVIASLEDTASRRASSLEVKIRMSLQDVLKSSLSSAVVNKRHRWIRELIQSLHESHRTILEGPTLSLTLSTIFTTLEECYRENPDPLNVLLESFHASSSMYNALCAMDSSTVEELVHQRAQEMDQDPSYLVFHMTQSSSDLQLPHCACTYLRGVAQGDNSNSTLFESWGDSSQDGVCFSVLEMYRLLLRGQAVSKDCWDFLLCSLVSLTQLLRDIIEEDPMTSGEVPHTCSQSRVNVTVFTCHLLALCGDVAVYYQSPDCPQTMVTEWSEFFRPALQEALLAIYLSNSAPARCDHTVLDSCLGLQQQSLCRALASLSLAESPDVETFRHLMWRFNSHFYPDQLAAYLLCKSALESYDIVTEDSSREGDKKPLNVVDLQKMLLEVHDKVNMDLAFMEDKTSHLTDGEGLTSQQEVAPTSRNGHSHTTSYLLMWLLMMESVRHCTAEVRAVMVHWLKEQSLFDHFLQGLFKYLNDNSDKSTHLAVTCRPSLEQLCFLAYSSVAKQLPSMLRQWHLTLDRQTALLVSKFTSKYVSSDLQHADLRTVSSSQTSVDNMEVRVYSGASEVAVTYKVDDFSIELFVCLPDSYPLQPPTIREGKRVKMDPAQWRKWMLQLTIFVTNQNGSLLDGLLLWKNNLDKHFSGAEECMICFSVIHGSTYALPKMMCRTCKKKFHSTCLYKWFNTSTKSSCPLCRNIF